MAKHQTPLLDQLETGPWPSFVSDIKQEAAHRAANPDGSEGALIALAQQKRMALKEQVTFYADEAKTQPLFSFKARKVMDLNSGYDVTDPDGKPIAFFKKDFGASLLRSTFLLEGPGYEGKGQEENQVVAILRRFVDFPFLPIHFVYHDNQGNQLLRIERQFALRDRYTVTVPDPSQCSSRRAP